MKRKERIEKAKNIVEKLNKLNIKLNCIEDMKVKNEDFEKTKINEELKILALELSTLRFIQAERRLIQQILIGFFSFLEGSALTLIVKIILD